MPRTLKFIDKDFYMHRLAIKSNPKGDLARNQGSNAPTSKGTSPVAPKNYDTGIQPRDDSEIWNSSIASKIDVLIESLSKLNQAVNDYKKESISRIADAIDEVVEKKTETTLSNIAQLIHLEQRDSAAIPLLKLIWQELPKISEIINNPIFMSFFYMTPEGKSFLDNFKSQIDDLNKNFDKPQSPDSSGNQQGQGRTGEIMRAKQEKRPGHRKELLDKFLASHGPDGGIGKINQFFGDVHKEQNDFINSIERIVDTFGNLEDEEHAGYHSFRDNKGKMIVERPETSGSKKAEREVIDARFMERARGKISEMGKSHALAISDYIKSLNPKTKAADALSLVQVVNLINVIKLGTDAVDPVTGKMFKLENRNTVQNSLNSYFKNNDKPVSIFMDILSGYDMFNSEVGDVAKSYTIKSAAGEAEAKVRVEYFAKEVDDDGEEIPGPNDSISGVFMLNGKEINLGSYPLDDFLYEKSIREKTFISKIISGNTQYVVGIYNYLIDKYIEKTGISAASQFKDSVLWAKIKEKYVTNPEEDEEDEDFSASAETAASPQEQSAPSAQSPQATGWLQGKALPKKLYDAHKNDAKLEDGFDISSTINVFRSGGNQGEYALKIDPEGQRQWRGGMGDRDSYAYHAYHKPSNTMLMTDFRGREKEELFKLLDDLIQSKGVKNITEKDLEAIREKVEGKRASGRMEPSTMVRTKRSDRFNLFKTHPRVMAIVRASSEDNSAWEDILADKTSELRISFEQLLDKYSELEDVNDDIREDGETPELAAERDAAQKLIQDIENKITSSFPGIDISLVTTPGFLDKIDRQSSGRPGAKAPSKPSYEQVVRDNSQWKKNLELIKATWPKYEARRTELESDIGWLKPEGPEYSKVKSEIDRISEEMGKMAILIEEFVSAGLISKEELYGQLYGDVPSLDKKYLDETMTSKINKEISEKQEEYDELMLDQDQASDDKKEGIQIRMAVLSGEIRDMKETLANNLSLGGSEEIERQKSYDEDKESEDILLSAKGARPDLFPKKKSVDGRRVENNPATDNLAWAYYNLLMDPNAKANTERMIDNLNSHDKIRGYIRQYFPGVINNDPAKPGILEMAKEKYGVTKELKK